MSASRSIADTCVMHVARSVISIFTAFTLAATLIPTMPNGAAYANEKAGDATADTPQLQQATNAICGNCIDENTGSNVEAQEDEADTRLAEALVQLEEGRKQAETEEQSNKAELEAAQATIDARTDNSITDNDMILDGSASGYLSSKSDEAIEPDELSETAQTRSVTIRKTARLAAAKFSTGSPGYSADITYKDIKSLSVYEKNSDGSIFNMGMLNIDYFNPTDLLAYVECYRIPSFYAEIESAKTEGDKYYLTLKLPTPAGEQQKCLDVLWGYINGSYARPVSQNINDETILPLLEQVHEYDAAHNNAYINAYKLAPFASFEDIVKSGNAIPADSPLATKTILESWPVHKDAGMKVSLRAAQAPDIVRAVVCFSDGTSQTLDVSYLGTSQLAASYIAAEPEILYQPNFWILDDSVSGNAIEKVASFIKSKTWNNYFKNFCRDVEVHRTIRDYFDKDIHDEAEEVAANLLTNVSGWCATAPDTVVWNSIMTRSMEAKPETTLSSTIREHKMFDMLFLYTYYERFYGFDIGGSEAVGAQKNANPFLLIAFKGNVIKPGLSLANMASDVRYPYVYTFSLTDKTASGAYSSLLAQRTGAPDVPSFLETIVKRTTDYTDTANWFADYMSSRYFYKEFEPVGAEGMDTGKLVWRGWDQAKRFPDYLLGWVTLDDASQYMGVTSGLLATGTSTGYYADPKLDDAHRAAFEKLMSDKAFSHMAKYAATASTIVGVDRVNSVCVVSIDRKWNKNEGTAWLEREKLWGKTLTEDDYCKNFTDAIGIYNNSSNGAAVMTLNRSLNYKRLFFFYGALECGWAGFWSHEMAHAVDNDWFLQGGARRAGTEDYTDGLLTQSFGQYSYSMNLTYDYDLSADVATNLTRARIGSTEKLNDYYDKMYDALDLLDYATLQAFLRLDKDEQNAVASQIQYDGQNGSSALDTGATATILRSRNAILSDYDGTAATAPLNLSAFIDGEHKFDNVEQVYDNQIFLRPGIPDTGKVVWLWDLYVQEDTKGVWWHPVHSNGSHPDSRSFKLEMYRILADYGYDAFADFGSGGGGDLAKLKAISGYDSFKEQQLAKWNEIAQNTGSLTYVDFDALVSKFEEALKEDASKANRNLSQMSALRTRMYYMMKRVTNDFTYGIYDNQTPVTYIRNLDELRAIKDNPYGNYALANDIDASAFEGADGQALIEGVFYGKFDGCGHTIYANGHTLPYLFSNIKNAYVRNVILKGGVNAKPSILTTNSELENIQYDFYAEKIYSIEDFANIPNTSSGANLFMLMNDLDFSDWKPTAGNSVVSGMFSGTKDNYKELNGNGHTITGLNNATLFDKVCWANIHDLVIKDSSNIQNATSGSEVSFIAKASAASRFSDIFFENISLQGKDRVGCISGSDGFIDCSGKATSTYGSQFNRIQAMGCKITHGARTISGQDKACCYVGFVTGRSLNSDFNDIYAQGSITTFGTCCGGIVGAITQSSRLNRCIANVDIERMNNHDNASKNAITKNGCLLGDIESIGNSAQYGETLISNCFGLGNPAVNVNKECGRLAWSAPTAGSAAQTVFKNCFENAYIVRGKSLTGLDGISWVNTDDSFRAYKVPQPTYEVPDLRNNKAFFTDLGFSENVWDFDVTIPSGYPVLRILDESSVSADLDIRADYKNEKIMLSGSDYSAFGTYINKLPMWNKVANQPYDPSAEMRLSIWNSASASYENNDGEINLSEIIELDVFGEDTREVIFKQYPADSGKAVIYEKTVTVPPRFDNPYAGNISGVDANEAGGMGAIGIDSATLQGAAGGFEYQRVPDNLLQYATEKEDGSTVIPSSKFPTEKWAAINSTTTKVAPGKYAVRLGSYEKSFASNPAIITVGEYDAGAVRRTITFETNGGTWSSESEPNVPKQYVEGKRLALPGPETITRDGYSFVGWYTNADFSGDPLTEISADATGDITLHACWNAEEYQVELVLNNGYFENPNDNLLSYKYGTGALLPASPVREGYDFAGWYEDESFAGDPVASIGASDKGAKRFYAKWEVEPCTITYHLGGNEGSDETMPSFTTDFDAAQYSSYVPGQAFMLPSANDLVWEGHTFIGWHDNASCSGEPITEILATDNGDKEFFAEWAKDAAHHVYVISYVTHGGVFDPEPKMVYEVGVDGFTADSVIQLPAADTIKKDKHIFKGWYTNADYSGSPITDIVLSEHNTTLYAKWELNQFDVTLHINGGTLAEGMASQFAYEGGETVTLPEANDISREGYSFAGWYDNIECNGSEVSSITASDRGDKQFWAKWEPGTYNVTLHTNEGALAGGASNVLTYDVGTGVILPEADGIFRTGHDFRGWFDNAECTGSALLHVSPIETGDKQFWAKWEPSVYEVALEGNGGFLAANQTPVNEYVYGEGAALPIMEREGYKFLGWFDNPECSGLPISVIESDSVGAKTFYAGWELLNVNDPDSPIPPVDPNPPVDPADPTPAEPSLEIISISFEGVGEQKCEWDETGYAKIVLPREKMPKTEDDFKIKLPDNVRIESVNKRDNGRTMTPLAAAKTTDKSANDVKGSTPESDIWDITLSSVINPNNKKIYTLEIEPEDSVTPDPGPENPPENPSIAPDSPDDNSNQDVNDEGDSNNASDADLSAPQEDSRGELVATGDRLLFPFVALTGVVLISACIAVAALRRTTKGK